MKIRKELIGSKVKGGILSKWYTIEKGRENEYLSAGLYNIFEIDKPVLIKVDAKDRKKSIKHIDSDSVGTDYNSIP
jgi:hypothetical protein